MARLVAKGFRGESLLESSQGTIRFSRQEARAALDAALGLHRQRSGSTYCAHAIPISDHHSIGSRRHGFLMPEIFPQRMRSSWSMEVPIAFVS